MVAYCLLLENYQLNHFRMIAQSNFTHCLIFVYTFLLSNLLASSIIPSWLLWFSYYFFKPLENIFQLSGEVLVSL